MEKRFVYADNAATTRVSDEVVAAMLPYFTEYYGNPSAVYGLSLIHISPYCLAVCSACTVSGGE